MGSKGAIVALLEGSLDLVFPEGLQLTNSSVVKRQSNNFNPADPGSLWSLALASLRGSTRLEMSSLYRND